MPDVIAFKEGKLMNISLNGKEIKKILTILESFSDAYDPIRKKLERALKPIKISSRKAKGRNLQQQVCKDIAKIIDIEYDQQDDNCLIHSREMGQAGKDIILRGIAQEIFPYSIECKCTENLQLDKGIKQAKYNMNKDDTGWMVIHKKKNQPILITIEWDLFLFFYLKLY